MTDRELIGYVEIHSKTERALFHADYLTRFLTLAGVTFVAAPYGFYAFHYDREVREWIERARRAITLGSLGIDY